MDSIDDQVLDFFNTLFEKIFSGPFESLIPQRRKRNDVVRQIEASADAASQSLYRFFRNEQLKEQAVANILNGFAGLSSRIQLEDIANPNVAPEELADDLLADSPCPQEVQETKQDAVYRVALHSVVQVLMLVGPVVAEWQKLNFSSTFELPRQIVSRLNQITEQLDALSHSGQEAADERFELTYRDFLLQRFHRVEAGTVRMTTNLAVDLRELFVMPHIELRPLPKKEDSADSADAEALMDLASARALLSRGVEETGSSDSEKKDDPGVTALEQVRRYPLNVIIGVPGSGKSTFLEWLQLQVADAAEVLVMGDQQAIPLLLRVRQLDPEDLPRGSALIEKATASRDLAALMPEGWVDRQMKQGRVLFMLDGLDETAQELKDSNVLPWLLALYGDFQDCRFLVSSRPTGYPPGTLGTLQFHECDLCDFGEPQIGEYTRHWCTAIRLAQNEPEEEARREGAADGEAIVEGFKDHPYIRNLARNPLMLSAVCLVNYFEGGHLPQDRAMLYRLCVEGLLHHWDQRRGIHSEFTFEEKLRTCREVALAMQADDRAEYEAAKIEEIFTRVLSDSDRARKLLEHIRYRTGLLIERRADIFAFAHLTFQEYLAARAIHEGNQPDIEAEQLAREHNDGRWQEVIALYCGLAPFREARRFIEILINTPDTLALSGVLAEAYLSSGSELAQDQEFRRRVLERIATAPGQGYPDRTLDRFAVDEVAPIANFSAGKTQSQQNLSESCRWLETHSDQMDADVLIKKRWQELNPYQITELVYLLHAFGGEQVLKELKSHVGVYAAPGPRFSRNDDVYETYGSQAEIALLGLGKRDGPIPDELLLPILRALSNSRQIEPHFVSFEGFQKWSKTLPQDMSNLPEFASLTRRLANRFGDRSFRQKASNAYGEGAIKDSIEAVNSWADSLERISEQRGQ